MVKFNVVRDYDNLLYIFEILFLSSGIKDGIIIREISEWKRSMQIPTKTPSPFTFPLYTIETQFEKIRLNFIPPPTPGSTT